MTPLRIDFEPVGRRIEIQPGMNLLEAAQAAGVQLASVCGGIGSCDSCLVRIVSGKLSAPTLEEEAALSPEELDGGYRLACQSFPASDVKVDIPPESLTTPQRLQVEGREVQIELDPVVIPVEVQLDPARLDDLQADDVRLKNGLKNGLKNAMPPGDLSAPRLSLPVMRALPGLLRANGWRVRLAQRGGEIVAVLPSGARLAGLSVDIGTTKLAAYLVDLTNGETLAKLGAMNPQVGYGEDVISRIAYANQGPNFQATLQSKLVETLNSMVVDLCAASGLRRDNIVEAVIVGNTAMHHLFIGAPVRQLGEAPYVPAVAEPIEIRARDLGLELAEGAYLFIPPNVAGYVGADHVSMALASGLADTHKSVLALDIGTNTEISLAAKGRLLCCSTASGPVFEGAHIHDGMRAAPGAIERVQILPGELHLQTIDGLPAVGICGSGILDAVAEMLNAGILNASGRLQKDHPMVTNDRHGERGAGVELVPASQSGHGRAILVDRKDVHEIQLAKGAIRAGSEILLAEAGMQAGDLDEVVIAGAFGTYIHIPSAVRVGMFPDLPLERFNQVGNAAGVGAKQMLVSRARRQMAYELTRRMEYIELTAYPKFTQEFMKALYF